MEETPKETVIQIKSNRALKAQKAQAIQHLTPSVLLVSAGLEALEHVLVLGIFEILAGACMFIVAIWEIRQKHHHEGAAVHYADLFAAAMLLAEGLNRAHEGGHYLPYAYVLLSVFMAVRAYGWKWLADRRRVVLNDQGFSFRRKFRITQFEWREIESMDVTDSRIIVHVKGARRIIDLSSIENREEITNAFRAHTERMRFARH